MRIKSTQECNAFKTLHMPFIENHICSIVQHYALRSSTKIRSDSLDTHGMSLYNVTVSDDEYARTASSGIRDSELGASTWTKEIPPFCFVFIQAAHKDDWHT